VIDGCIERFENKMLAMNSIDLLISSHKKFVSEIVTRLCLRNQEYKKLILKIFNLIKKFPHLVVKFILGLNNRPEDGNEALYHEVFNQSQKFEKYKNKYEAMTENLEK
jgi:hypothetical protein